ncbi:hypothetical protein C0995_014708, partial [Termitomyces sp. Mi166
NAPAMPPPSVPSQTPLAQELRETAKQSICTDKLDSVQSVGGSVILALGIIAPKAMQVEAAHALNMEMLKKNTMNDAWKEKAVKIHASMQPAWVTAHSERSGRECTPAHEMDKDGDRDKEQDRPRDRHDRDKDRKRNRDLDRRDHERDRDRDRHRRDDKD